MSRGIQGAIAALVGAAMLVASPAAAVDQNGDGVDDGPVRLRTSRGVTGATPLVDLDLREDVKEKLFRLVRARSDFARSRRRRAGSALELRGLADELLGSLSSAAAADEWSFFRILSEVGETVNLLLLEGEDLEAMSLAEDLSGPVMNLDAMVSSTGQPNPVLAGLADRLLNTFAYLEARSSYLAGESEGTQLFEEPTFRGRGRGRGNGSSQGGGPPDGVGGGPPPWAGGSEN